MSMNCRKCGRECRLNRKGLWHCSPFFDGCGWSERWWQVNAAPIVWDAHMFRLVAITAAVSITLGALFGHWLVNR